MKKEIIINFLNKHWDEFTTLLSGITNAMPSRTLMEEIPDDLCEFTNLLSKILAVRQMYTTDKQKGLLEKAQQFRKNDYSYNREEHESIIVKNGLFIVQPQQYNETLDSSFKTLVDSVL